MRETAAILVSKCIDSVNRSNPTTISMDEIRILENVVEFRYGRTKATVSKETYSKIKDYIH